MSIWKDDLATLGPEKWLNDVIIDFYIKYLITDFATGEVRDKLYAFSTQFYVRLTAKTSEGEGYEGVKRWTKNVKIFEKDFIIIPMNLG